MLVWLLSPFLLITVSRCKLITVAAKAIDEQVKAMDRRRRRSKLLRKQTPWKESCSVDVVVRSTTVGTPHQRPGPPRTKRLWHLHRPCRRDHQVSRLPLFLHGRGPPASAPRLTNKNASCDSSDPSRRTGIGRLSVPKGWTVFQIPSTRTVFETTSTPLGPETPPLLHIAHRRSAAAVRPSLASRGSLALPLEHLVARPLGSHDKYATNDGGAAGRGEDDMDGTSPWSERPSCRRRQAELPRATEVIEGMERIK